MNNQDHDYYQFRTALGLPDRRVLARLDIYATKTMTTQRAQRNYCPNCNRFVIVRSSHQCV